MQTLAHENLRESHGSLCRDVIVPNLKVLFCGINPSLMSAAVGHHFARPGNRFWRTLAGADLTPRLLRPEEDQILPQFGIGITNLVARATRTAAELSPSEYRSGMRTLTAKVAQYRPRTIAFVGIGAYRLATQEPKASIGLQRQGIGEASVWVLPNPSGLNGHYQLPRLIELYRQVAPPQTLRGNTNQTP